MPRLLKTDEVDKFLEKYNLFTVIQDETENLNY